MKFAKSMLMLIVIFSVVGGVLAAGTYSTKFCVGTCDGVNTLVPTINGAHKFTVDQDVPSLLYRTTDVDGDPIDAAADCINLTTTTTNCTRMTNQ
jgi:hypothetical protein